MLGNTWGISPKLMYWAYSKVTIQILLYKVLVWWTAWENRSNWRPFAAHLFKHCIILNLRPVAQIAEGTSRKSAVNLCATEKFVSRPYSHWRIIGNYICSIYLSCIYLEDKLNIFTDNSKMRVWIRSAVFCRVLYIEELYKSLACSCSWDGGNLR